MFSRHAERVLVVLLNSGNNDTFFMSEVFNKHHLCFTYGKDLYLALLQTLECSCFLHFRRHGLHEWSFLWPHLEAPVKDVKLSNATDLDSRQIDKFVCSAL